MRNANTIFVISLYLTACTSIPVSKTTTPPASSLPIEETTILISEVQTLLNKKGYSVGASDGIVGPKTRTAIRKFEKANNLPVDGLVDDALYGVLKHNDDALKHNVSEVTTMPSDSPLSQIRKGMGLRQVMTILGPPTDQETNASGKAFIPFYFGSDAVRTKLYYKGLGWVQFGSGVSGGGPKVNHIAYDPNEDGFKGNFTDGKNVVTVKAPQKGTQSLPARFQGVWQGNINQTNAGSYTVIINLKNKPATINYPTLNCSGTAALLRSTSSTAEFRESIATGKSICTNSGTFELVLSRKNKAKMNWYYLNGQLAASGTLRRK